MTSIVELLKIKQSDGDVGIEIEAEGAGLKEIYTPCWRTEHDGSLRGTYPETCAEFILKKPIPIDAVRGAMAEFHSALPKAKFQFSFRTSCHVHVNIQQLEYNELLAFMYTYLLIEEPLMQFCGQTRIGNRFCLRLADAEGMMDMLYQLFSNPGERLRGSVPRDLYRYAAMNVDAIFKYGSLEFRGMRGTADTDTIVTWTQALVNLRDFSQKLNNPTEVFELFAYLGPEKFFEKAIGKDAAKFQYPMLVADLQRSFSLTLDLPFAYKASEEREYVPPAKVKKAKAIVDFEELDF